MEPRKRAYLIINALQTLNLLQSTFDDQGSGNWYINIPSSVLSIAMILQNGDIVPTN